jgi:glycosyltransferase involved in cell wall biosynthesis
LSEARLTFAIPFHRGLDYLRIAIESVLAQRLGDWRLLVLDDGRVEDGAEALVMAFADPRIRYLANAERLGMVGNWNRCLDEADTDLVTLLHADDRALPGYAELMTKLADRHPQAAALFCSAQIIDAKGKGVSSFADSIKRVFTPAGPGAMLLSGEGALRALMAGNFIMCPTLCYRKSVLGERRFEAEWQQVQDLEFTTRLLLEGELLVGSRDVAYAYRRHSEAATELQSQTLLRFDEEFRLFAQVALAAERAGWIRAARVARAPWIVRLHLAYRALRELATLRPRAATSKLRLLVERW